MTKVDLGTQEEIKYFYGSYQDRIFDKRYNSPYWIRRYTHRQIYNQILGYIQKGQRVLDAGCGEGILSLLAAEKGAIVTGTDISHPNIVTACHLATEWHVSANFLQGDAEHLPFPDSSFDVVISSHVLEHLPNPWQGLRELYRVSQSLALIVMPTCLSPACWILLGGDDYWKLSHRSVMALPLGVITTAMAFVRGEEGPNEGYAGNKRLPHLWRFPWILRRRIEETGFKLLEFRAGPLIIPYVAQYVPFVRKIQFTIDRWCNSPILRYFGYGTLAVCKKNHSGAQI